MKALAELYGEEEEEGDGAGGEAEEGDAQEGADYDENDVMKQTQVLNYNYASKGTFPCPLPTGGTEIGLTVVPTEVIMGPNELSFVWEAVFMNEGDLLKDIEAVRKHITESSSGPMDAVTLHRVEIVCNVDLHKCFSDRGGAGKEEKEKLSQLVPPKWLRRILGKRLIWRCRSSDRKKAMDVMQFLSLCLTGKVSFKMVDSPGMSQSKTSHLQNHNTKSMLSNSVQRCVQGLTQATFVWLVNTRSVPNDVQACLEESGALATIASNPEAFRFVILRCVDNPQGGWPLLPCETNAEVDEFEKEYRKTAEELKMGYLSNMLCEALEGSRVSNANVAESSSDAAAASKDMDEKLNALDASISSGRLMQFVMVDAVGTKLSQLPVAVDEEERKLQEALQEGLSVSNAIDKITAPLKTAESQESHVLVVLARLLQQAAPLALVLAGKGCPEELRANLKKIGHATEKLFNLIKSYGYEDQTSLGTASLVGITQLGAPTC
eukprot:gene18248-24701_t